MRWRKLGCIFAPDREADWMVSHAMLPTPEHISEDVYRVYFSTRDTQNRSNGGWVDIDVTDPQRILAVSPQPVLEPGPLGGFDDSGALPSSLVSSAGKRYLFYIGYNLGVTVPFRNFVGLAIADAPDAPFAKASRGPILERNDIDPYLTVTPFVRKENDGWRMWYATGTSWELVEGRPRHYYHIKYAESDNGFDWVRKGSVCIDYESPEEHAIARPCVIRDGDRYRMWYCYRGSTYRIGYAESDDGVSWKRMDSEVGIEVSADGWDSEMIEYPYVFDHRGERYLLYNGNRFGQTGFGMAVLEKD